MDNVCHTLVGAALGYSGLRRRAPLANATLMIAANLPDLDVLVFATDTPSVSFRRGWTHGVVAQLLLPVALTAVMLVVGRRRFAEFGVKRAAGILLLLSYLGVYSHVLLDYLNTYGLRLLAPIDWRWFYGDTLFIVDPALWVVLGAGVWLSRRDHSPRPARIGLAVASLYVVAMLASAQVARAMVADAWQAQSRTPPAALMVGPVFANPFEREVIVDAGNRYATGRFSWRSRNVTWGAVLPKSDSGAAVAAARQTPAVRAFLVWSRFPYFRAHEEAGGTRVEVGDARFSLNNPLRGPLGRIRFTASALVPRRAAAAASSGSSRPADR